MKLIQFGLLYALALGSAQLAHATILLRAPDPVKHDRFQTPPNPSFIGNAYDWSGVGRGSDRGWATAIAPSFIISATHYPPVGTLRFYHTNDPTGSFEDRTIVAATNLGNGDLYIGRLNAPLSSSVAKYSILDLPNFSDYNNLEIFTYGLNVVHTAQTQTSVRLGRNVITPGTANYYPDLDPGPAVVPGAVFVFNYDNPGLGADESYVVAGDSGGPSFHIYSGKPSLVGIHWFQTSGPDGSGDSLVPYYIDNIQAWMNTQPGGETLTLVPEPSSLVLAGVAVACAGRVLRKRARKPHAAKNCDHLLDYSRSI
jgi:hypothetical protein